MSSLESPKAGFRLTGRHVAIILVTFFGVMLTANITFMTAALRTFTGTTVPNPYEKGVAWNKEVARFEAEAKLGWVPAIGADLGPDAKTLTLTVEMKDRDGQGLDGLTVRARLTRPVEKLVPLEVTFAPIGGGRYLGQLVVPARGGWDVRVEAERGADQMRFGQRFRI